MNTSKSIGHTNLHKTMRKKASWIIGEYEIGLISNF